MASYCDVVEETLGISDGLGMVLLAPLTEGAKIHGLVPSCGMLTPYVESAVIGDVVLDLVQSRVVESLVIGDTISSVTSGTNTIVESARVGDRLPAIVVDSVAESMAIGDIAADAIGADRIVESMAMGCAVSDSATLRNAIDERAKIAGRVVVAPVVDATVESAMVRGACSGKTLGRNAVVESAAVAGILAGSSIRISRAVASAVIGDTLSGAITAQNVIIESGEIGDGLGEAALLSGKAWAAPTDLFAMTRYESFPFNSMAEIDGVLVGVSTNGAYILDGATDAGQPIAATIVGELNDWVDGDSGPTSSPQMRRPHHLWLGYKSSGPLRVSLGHTGNGAETTIDHEMPASLAMAPGSGRVALAHGATFRYSRLTIANVGGADFEIMSGKVNFRMLQRRL